MQPTGIVKGVVSSIRKRLFVFCDGTWQDGVNSKRPLTNVATLARCLEGVADDNYLQLVYYDNGVGNATSLSTQIVDGATGRGISNKIKNAYSFLSHNYDFNVEGDEIFLIGYSRGAFTVQCLASFISRTGLLRQRHLYYLGGLFKLWAHHNIAVVGNSECRPLEGELDRHVRMFQAEKLLYKVKIKACAVWDTVSSLGLPRPWPKPFSFVGNTIPHAVENAFQALALDETRAQFEPCIWKRAEGADTNAKQCWFLGSHADVGGNGDAALGAVTLVWIVAQLQEIVPGLNFNHDEIAKHLKHRLLEWNININPIIGQIKRTAILSTRSSSGLSTRSSPLWWLSGFKRREIDMESECNESDSQRLELVHFTVRLAMIQNRNRCRVLRKWTTRLDDRGRVYWERGNKTLGEDTLTENDAGPGPEYALLKSWCDDDPPLLRTDRSEFASRVHALVYDPVEGIEAKLGRFATFLGEYMILQNNHLAPNSMYYGLSKQPKGFSASSNSRSQAP
ncbi:hypothetical protein F5Y14DRAFT_465379 [Nemania sp. NC0429]|nr:hypothetical protein F5Y14DRAFT_465379 [Nemania sp. NC0429]